MPSPRGANRKHSAGAFAPRRRFDAPLTLAVWLCAVLFGAQPILGALHLADSHRQPHACATTTVAQCDDASDAAPTRPAPALPSDRHESDDCAVCHLLITSRVAAITPDAPSIPAPAPATPARAPADAAPLATRAQSPAQPRAPPIG